MPRVPPVRAREIVLIGAFVAGWSVGRTAADGRATVRRPAETAVALPPRSPAAPAAPAVRLGSRRGRWIAAGMVAALVVAGAGALATTPEDASAPLVPPAVAAHEHAVAAKREEAARIATLRRLQLAGIAGRRVGLRPAARPQPVVKPLPVVKPDERSVALATYVQALGPDTILRGLDASREQLEQQVLHDARVHIYPAGIGDVASGRVDVRVLALIEYLAQANGAVTVSCLISGHSYFVHGRPGVVSAHTYGRAVDISAVAGIPILGHQGAGSVTERTIKQMLALPGTVEPLQMISLMTLGGPSFALPDHYNHIHAGF